MKNKFKLLLLGIMFLSLYSTHIYSQQISDVYFELEGENISIYYSLSPITSDEFEISLILKRTSVPNFNYSPKELKGDIGEGKFAGIERKIIWYVTDEEMNMFDGDDFYFEVFAEKIKKSGGIPWYYYVGTAAVGGVAAILLSGGSDSDKKTTTSQSFPPPPDRP